MLHYDPQHVSSSTPLILRRANCITTASGIVTLVNSHTVCRLRADSVRSQPAYCTAVYESDDTRGCSDTICPLEDERGAARNVLRIVMQHTHCWRIKELCIKLVIWKSFFKLFASCLGSYNPSAWRTESALNLHTVRMFTRVTIPEAVVIQFVLLRKSGVLLETRWGS